MDNSQKSKAISRFSGGIIPPERLAQMENSSYWDEEPARGLYFFPLRTKHVGEIRIAGKQLAIGIPDNQIYDNGPFLCCKSPQSHIGPYRWAVDFLIIDGSEVLAARDGEVIECVDSFSEWGDNPEFAARMNLITIKHGSGTTTEYSQYCHLAKSSAKVKCGESVKAGKVIAMTGKVGWTDRDHLHFIVFRDDTNGPVGFKSLKINKFKVFRKFWFF